MTEILNTLGGLVAALGNTQSAGVLREQVALLRMHLDDAERRRAHLDEQVRALTAQAAHLSVQAAEFQAQNAVLRAEQQALQAQLQQARTQPDEGGNPKRHTCHACGSQRIHRSGSRPDPVFGGVGIRQMLYTCTVCATVSAFTNDE